MRIYSLPRIYTVQGDSMEPSLRDGDVLLVRRLATANALIGRGDIVVANDPGDAERYFVKRVVGLPDECIALKNGLLTINGEHLAEPYLSGLPAYLGTANDSWQLNDGGYFLMGDNRVHSTDSRDFGPVASAALTGRVGLRLWPPHRWRAF